MTSIWYVKTLGSRKLGGARSDLQVWFENDLVTLDPLALDSGDDALDRQASHLRRLLGDAGQADRRKLGHLAVVPTDDRKVPRHLDGMLRQQPHGAHGGVVVVGDQSSREGAPLQKRPSGSPAGRLGLTALHP